MMAAYKAIIRMIVEDRGWLGMTGGGGTNAADNKTWAMVVVVKQMLRIVHFHGLPMVSGPIHLIVIQKPLQQLGQRLRRALCSPLKARRKGMFITNPYLIERTCKYLKREVNMVRVARLVIV